MADSTSPEQQFRASLLNEVRLELRKHLEISINAEKAGRENILNAILAMDASLKRSLETLDAQVAGVLKRVSRLEKRMNKVEGRRTQ